MALRDGVAGFEAPVEPAIRYPCYVPFDGLIDVERLKSLDAYIRERLMRHVEADSGTYFQNDHTLNDDSAREPGVREIWLSRNRDGVEYDYLNLNDPDAWEPTERAEEFRLLIDFIATLPFAAIGRMLIIYDNAGHAVPAHRDHLQPELCHEFVWLRTNKSKPFFMLNHRTGERRYVESYSAWFDTVNQFHGTDACAGLGFSIRVDGVFDDTLRKRIPTPRYNAASAPALWACGRGGS